MTIFTSDRALLDAFRRGEKAALTQVYWFYVKDVDQLMRCGFFIADKRASVPGVRDRTAHLEQVQEVFARAFAESARLAYNALYNYRPYIMRIAKNLLVDRARKKDRHVLDALDDRGLEEAIASDSAPTLGQELDTDPGWQKAAEATREFIATLPERERGYVERRFVARQSQTDAGDALGLSRKQARALEEKIRVALRAFLLGRGVVEAA